MRLSIKFFLLMLFPPSLYADNLAVLAYPVLFWPAGFFCLLLFALFTVLLLRRVKKRQFQKGSVVFGLIFLILTLFALFFFIFVLLDGHSEKFPGLFQITAWPLVIGSLFPLISASLLIFKVIKHKDQSAPQELKC